MTKKYFFPDKDPVRLVNTLSKEPEKLSEWFRINKLSLNMKKSNYMVLCMLYIYIYIFETTIAYFCTMILINMLC